MSGRSSRMVFCQNVPATTVYSPGRAPAPSSPSCVSAPPATTGVPGRRPVCPAAAAVTVPITVPGSCTGGSTLAGRPLSAAISSDQARSARLNIPELDPQDGSVASTPDSRVAIQSLSMPRPLVRGQDVRPVPGQPAQPGRRGDRHPVAAERVDAIGRALADQVDGLLARAGVDVGAGPDLPAGRVVEHDALAHAGRRHGADAVAGRSRGRERVPDAGGDRPASWRRRRSPGRPARPAARGASTRAGSRRPARPSR